MIEDDVKDAILEFIEEIGIERQLSLSDQELLKSIRKEWDEMNDEEKAMTVWEELFDLMENIAPESVYFGSHPGDGSNYGFWPMSFEEIKDYTPFSAEFNVEKLAKVITKAAEIHEECWNKEAYSLEVESSKRNFIRMYGSEKSHWGMWADPQRFYHYSKEEAAELACKNMGLPRIMGRFIQLALDGWWNDVLDWCGRIRKITGGDYESFND